MNDAQSTASGNALARLGVATRVLHQSLAIALVAVIAAAAGATTLAGCTASGDDIAPPQESFFFPAALTLSQDGASLFVVNANPNLLYDSGTISVVDTAAIDAVIAPWLASRAVPSGCYADSEFPETLVCDEAAYIRPDAGVRIGNFASGIASVMNEAGEEQVLVTVRGDPSITWASFDGTALACHEAAGFAVCDLANRLTEIGVGIDDEHKSIFAEPFMIAADQVGHYAVATHFSRGAVTVVDARGATPILSDAVDGLFVRNSTTQVLNSSAVAIRPNYAAPDQPGVVYVGSSGEDRIQTATVTPNYYDQARLIASNYFFINAVGANGGGGSDTRGIAFDDAERMYVLGRSPASLLQYDVSLDLAGEPTNRSLAGTDTCRQATSLATVAIDGVAYAIVACFGEGTVQIYRVDPFLTLVQTASVGRGPTALSISSDKTRAYVANYLDDSVAVVDLAAGSATQFRVVLRMGEPRE